MKQKATGQIQLLKGKRVWQWSIIKPSHGRKYVYGGYCRTKRDAPNDAGKMLEHLQKGEQL